MSSALFAEHPFKLKNMKMQIRTTLLLGLLLGLSTYLQAQASDQEQDQYGGFLDINGKKTGYFHVEKINGRWWMVTPEGNGFYGIGISHASSSFSQGAVNFAYNGDQEEFFRDGVTKLKDLGYNCSWGGPYSQERIREGFIDPEIGEAVYKDAEFPYALHVPIIKHSVELKPGETRPDVFSKEYKLSVIDLVNETVAENKDNSWLLGYYYGYGSFMIDNAWVNETINREAESTGRVNLLKVLEDRYTSDIEKYNSIYQTSYKSFIDLKKNGSVNYKIPFRFEKNPAIKADLKALLTEIIVQFYKVGHEEIRKVDQNHMILGTYPKHFTFDLAIWKKITPYIDILAPQDISDVNPINEIVKATGLPAFFSDQEYGNVYPLSLQGTNGCFGAVPDYIDRRVYYDLIFKRIMSDPDIVGASLCACLFDNSHWVQAYDRGQPGFFTIDGEPRLDLCKTVSEVNAMLPELVFNPKKEAEIKQMHAELLELRAAYNLVMEKRKNFLPSNPPYMKPAIIPKD